MSNSASQHIPDGVIRRTVPIADLEIRANADGTPPTIAGYAAVFNQQSEVIGGLFGGFREVIKPGAFTRTISNGSDIRALINHDPNYVLGRTKSGTLSLREDTRGLWMEVTAPDTQWARDLVATMRRGDVDQCSFGFRVVGKPEWDTTVDADGKERDLHIVNEAQLYDVSVVTFPAYPQTSASVRSLLSGPDLDIDALAQAAQAIHEDLCLLRDAVRTLPAGAPNTAVEPAAPVPPEDHAAQTNADPPPTGHSLTGCLNRLAEHEARFGKE